MKNILFYINELGHQKKFAPEFGLYIAVALMNDLPDGTKLFTP